MLNFLLYNKRPTGFTLLEVIISICIVSVISLAILSIFPYSLQISKSAEFNSIAAALAQSKIEELSVLGYDSLPTGELENKIHVSDNPNSPFYVFLRTTSITYLDGDLNEISADQGIKKISTSVYWNSPLYPHPEKSVTFKSIISKK